MKRREGRERGRAGEEDREREGKKKSLQSRSEKAQVRTMEREAERRAGQGKERSEVRVDQGRGWVENASKRCSVSPVQGLLILCLAQVGPGSIGQSLSQAAPSQEARPVFTRTGNKRHGSHKCKTPKEWVTKPWGTTQAPLRGRHPFWEPRGKQPQRVSHERAAWQGSRVREQGNYRAPPWTSPVAQLVKNLPAMQETQEMWVPSLGWEDPLEKSRKPAPVFLLGERHGQRRLVGYSPWSCKESDTTEWLSTCRGSECLPHRQKKGRERTTHWDGKASRDQIIQGLCAMLGIWDLSLDRS